VVFEAESEVRVDECAAVCVVACVVLQCVLQFVLHHACGIGGGIVGVGG